MKSKDTSTCPNDKPDDITTVVGNNIREKIITINTELSKLRNCPPRSYVDQYNPGYYSIGMQYRCKKKGKLIYERCEDCPGG